MFTLAMTGVLVTQGCNRGPARDAGPVHGPFTVHEWGLLGIDARSPTRATVATEATGHLHWVEREHSTLGLGAMGGKPVIYVHLDDGIEEASFGLRLGLPAAALLERWPESGASAPNADHRAVGWSGVRVRRGACTNPTTPPTPDSPSCRSVRDGFCEAAEIPRYEGGRSTCLSVGNERSEVLFYRAADVPTAGLPLRLEPAGDQWIVRRVAPGTLEGPVFWIEAAVADRPTRILRIGENDFDRPLALEERPGVGPDFVRVELRVEAVRRGLSAAESEAFVDAWAPAYFDRCERSGPEASGTPPVALQQSRFSLLYFAPRSAIDAAIPLTTEPPARAVHRVFLVRYVDGAATLSAPPPTDRSVDAGVVGAGEAR